ncbi:MAG: orotate phosphoribosyltransferase, partial [Gaiellales bacterium]|nr:orotate phosphoribosyltransferase [Gaiellales bacterium]
MTREELAARLVERAYLEGDFLLRSGRRSRYYLDKYRFETDPVLLAGLGSALADLARSHAPDAELLAGPELGAVPLAAVTSIETGLP